MPSNNLRWRPILIGLWISALCPLGLVFADDVPLPLRDFLQNPEALGYSRASVFVQNFCATLVIEYLVIYGALGWPRKAAVDLLVWVLLANVITNPALQLGAVFSGRVMESEALAWVMICILELAAVTVESGLMRWAFARMYRGGLIEGPVSTKRTVMIVLAANVASFAIGFVAQICLLIEMAR